MTDHPSIKSRVMIARLNMPTKNCKHEKTFLWKLDRSMQRLVNFAIKKAGLNMNIKNLKQLRGYLLTCCLNCDKIVNMEVIAMPDDTYNPSKDHENYKPAYK